MRRHNARPGRFSLCFLVFTLVIGPRRSLSLKLSDTRVDEPHRAIPEDVGLEMLASCLAYVFM